MNTKRFLGIIFLTIFLYRLVTYIIIYFWGTTSWWHGVYTDKWNHYQIGLVLILISIFLYKLKRHLNFGKILAAIGTGMIVDEISEVLRLLRIYDFGPNFRDSLADLLLIIICYFLFAGTCLLTSSGKQK